MIRPRFPSARDQWVPRFRHKPEFGDRIFNNEIIAVIAGYFKEFDARAKDWVVPALLATQRRYDARKDHREG